MAATAEAMPDNAEGVGHRSPGSPRSGAPWVREPQLPPYPEGVQQPRWLAGLQYCDSELSETESPAAAPGSMVLLGLWIAPDLSVHRCPVVALLQSAEFLSLSQPRVAAATAT